MRHSIASRRRSRPCRLGWLLACQLAALLTLLSPAYNAGAETWSGALGLSLIGSSTSGSEGSFRTQYGLRDGLLIDEIELDREAGEATSGRFSLRASGFGGASPSERARLRFDAASPWSVRLDYDRRRSLFSLASDDLGRRSDRLALSRWRGSVSWDGFRPARLSLDLRHTSREGQVSRPFLALNALYPLALDLDEEMSEVGLRLETRHLPVKLIVEQSYARYRQRNRRAAAGATDLGGNDPDLLVAAATTRRDEQTIPSSRLTLSWGNRRLEAAGTFLYSPGDLTSSGLTSTTFDIDGGRVGRLDLIDDLLADGDLDTAAGNLRLGIALTRRFSLRLLGDHRDTSTDVGLLGTRLLRATNPLGELELSLPRADGSRVDLSDTSGRLELEWSAGRWTAWAGAFTASRDVDWQIGAEAPSFAVDRTTDGTLFGLAFSTGERLRLSVEHERGSFDRFVFRTDPETVDRLTLRLRSELARGVNLDLSTRLERADNPPRESGLDHRSDSASAALTWSSPGGGAGLGIDLSLANVTTRTGLILPRGEPGLSIYDLELLTTGVNGHLESGRLRFDGALSRVDDGGDSFPIEAWQARSEIAIEVAERTEVRLRAEYWSYDEQPAELDDYDVTRYGVGLRWRFE